MERLTFDGSFCDIAQCTETPGGSFCEDGYCSQKKVWERLKAYEDTNLAPEGVAKLLGKLIQCAADRKDLINELCQYCGKYKHAHKGACDGCRWREK